MKDKLLIVAILAVCFGVKYSEADDIIPSLSARIYVRNEQPQDDSVKQNDETNNLPDLTEPSGEEKEKDKEMVCCKDAISRIEWKFMKNEIEDQMLEFRMDREEHNVLIMEMRNRIDLQDSIIESLRKELSYLQEQRLLARKGEEQMKNSLTNHDWAIKSVKDTQYDLQLDLHDIKQSFNTMHSRVKYLEESYKKEKAQMSKVTDSLKDLSRGNEAILEGVDAQTEEIGILKNLFHQVLEQPMSRSNSEDSPSMNGLKYEEDVPLLLETGSGEDLINKHEEQSFENVTNKIPVKSEVPKSLANILVKQEVQTQKLIKTVKELEEKLTEQMTAPRSVNTTDDINKITSQSKFFEDEVSNLSRSYKQMKKKLDFLEKIATTDKTATEEKLDDLSIDIISVNRSTNTALRRIRQHSERSSNIEKSMNEDFTVFIDEMKAMDGRLTKVEVASLNATVQRCKKSDREREQDGKINNLAKEIRNVESAGDRVRRDLRETQKHVKELQKAATNIDGMLSTVLSLTKNVTTYIPEMMEIQAEVNNFVLHLPFDCTEEFHKGIRMSGTYLIKPQSSERSVRTWCELEGEQVWTYIQKRSDGSVDFNRDWLDYKYGFGDTRTEFWIGNENLYHLTHQDHYILYIGFWDIDGVYYYAEYENFTIDNEANGYTLNVSGYHGNATDAFTYSSTMKFSTPDIDNDVTSLHCARYHTSGWWYKHCHFSNLNGRYDKGIIWFNYESDEFMELKASFMKIRLRLD